MKIDSSEVFAELERLGAAFPWEKVQLDIDRLPEGEIAFCAYLSSDSDRGVDYIFGRGASPRDAVDDAIKQAAEKPPREPESLRQRRLVQLREAVKKLEETVLPTMPPFRPNRELSNGSVTVPDPVVEL